MQGKSIVILSPGKKIENERNLVWLKNLRRFWRFGRMARELYVSR